MGLHRRYEQFLRDFHPQLSLDKDLSDRLHERLTTAFRGLMTALFRQKGATLDVNILTSGEARHFISTHASILDSAFSSVEMSSDMRRSLQSSDYFFSSIKTFHELNEAFPSLLDENGLRKPFERFYNDVRKVDATYNRHYLLAEYHFAHASASMAAKWEQIAGDGDRYNLQYRTAGDDHVRPEHAALAGVTLPPSDPFWASYYPPNGWNCRCTAVQVRRNKYPETPHDEAMNRGEQALKSDKKGFFRFNSGIARKTFPDYNPYTIRRCRDCDIAKGKASLAFVPENELCAACRLSHSLEAHKEQISVSRAHIKKAQRDLVNWYKHELPNDRIGKFPARRFRAETIDNIEVIINKNFYQETINKYQDDNLYTLKLAYAKKAHEYIKKATLIDPREQSKDHKDEIFRVYEYTDDCYRVEMKIRCNRDGNFMHIIRVYKK